ncbi:MAG: transporter substrate-binding domain-containing protein, partial [Campylobacteraceae bacterium]|nr:transporter substrate-binding domain-containing protein [Campylobacteraceae bacterium]
VAWKKAIALVKQGKTAGFFPPYFNEKRTAWTKFSEPLVNETTVIFAKESTLKGKTNFPDDFQGMKVCLNRGFSPTVMGGDKLEKAIKDGQIKLVEAKDNKSCLSRVDRGIADFYLNDQLIDTSSFPMLQKGMNIKGNSGYVGFTLKIENYPFMADVQKKFNAVIKDMKKSGELDKIVQKYK